MVGMRCVVRMAMVVLSVLGAGVAFGQDYPNRPIRIVTSQIGGTLDFAARIVAQGIAGPMGQQVIVDNRAGIIGIEMVAKSQPDGYTLQLGSAAMWFAPFIRDNATWDPVKDFAPITLVARSPNILVVHPSLPVKSARELIALAKARPGELNYPSTSLGGTIHLAGELFKALANVDIVRVPYKGEGAAVNAILGGVLQFMFTTAGGGMPHIKSGRLRALAVTSAQPSGLLPGLPPVAASGLPGYEIVSTLGMFAPARTPAPAINRLNQEIVRVLAREDVKERFFRVGVETIGSTPEQLAATVKAEMTKMGKVIKDAGIKAD